MRTPLREGPAGASLLILATLLVAVLAACGGSATSPTVGDTETATPTADLLDDLGTAADELDELIDSDIEGQVDPDDGSIGATEGVVDPDNGFLPSRYVDADDLGRILGEMPEPECDHSTLLDGDACTWTTGNGGRSLGVELYRDPNLSTVEAYVEHMEALMSSGSPIDDLGAAAFSGRNPLGSGVRLTVFIGDGLHLWVTISGDGDEAGMYDQALDLASRIVAMH